MICFFLPLVLAAAAVGNPQTSKPNIIMLFVDDLGYGDVGFNGHPTTRTPNIDRLAFNGKILSSWYSGCPVCSGSRAALMTGRQFTRIGVPGVFGPTVNTGLPLNETTVADQMKKAGYATGICGKWHLGQRSMFLPGSRGFDEYLGIPYSDDMGGARATPCNSEGLMADRRQPTITSWRDEYCSAGFCSEEDMALWRAGQSDPAATYLPLVHQHHNTPDGSLNTTVLEQPLDFTHLAESYRAFVTGFIEKNVANPFFLYVPFSHVHTTNPLQPEEQYAGCAFKNTTTRGSFGDALHEVDSIIGSIVATLEAQKLTENTLILFTGDNGPWMIKGTSAGSPGLHFARTAGYWNVGKGSTWEGGIHEAAFATWPGTITAQTKSDEIVSSLDLLPTVSALVGVQLPTDRVYDGRDMSDILLDRNGASSQHDHLFFYGGAHCNWKGPSAMRYKEYKAHFATGPGLGGCDGCKQICYCDDPTSTNSSACQPLLFNIQHDPSEAYPLTGKEYASVQQEILKLMRKEIETFTYGHLVAPPDGPGEGKDKYGVCCDRNKDCDCDGPLPSLFLSSASSID